uniref:Zinc finger CCCH domain-containing protein 13 n=1 Tax=Anthurium amnicola TaxID=1678845 RepID=A0A1D1XYD6_9ARAE
MSGAPKRLHDEVSHPTASKRSVEEGGVFSTVSGKLIQPVSECHPSFGSGSDGRAAKVQRIEPRDVDRRASLLPMYRISSSASGSSLDHPVTIESRSELKDSEDSKDAKFETRETRVEARKLHTDATARIDAQVGETENNVRLENKDEKGLRSDLSHSDHKSDIRLEKDGYTANASHLNWKEPKEHHRGQRYTETPKDGLDPWRPMRYASRNTDEAAKDFLTHEEREAFEAREAVGENRLDLKGEERLKDKERKRKDEKHRDWGERDKERSEHRNNLQIGNAGNERKEYMRDDRESDRWDRERKDAQKDKERKDREKDQVKRELLNAIEKDSFRNEETLEGLVRTPEKESTALESKRHKELDNCKSVDRDIKDKRKDRESDNDPDKHDRHRFYEKESEDGCTGVIERDRENFGYAIQQRRRMLRARGTPQSSNREPRYSSRQRENEGSQGKSEVSTITYKVGECMQDLLKSWEDFEASLDGKVGEGLQNGPTLEIQIPAEHVTATNRQVRGGQLWGTDLYTNDSDLVAVLMHTGYCRPTASLPPPAIQELRATIRVLPPQNCYYSTLRNNVRSRAWGSGIGCSFRVESCCMVKRGGGTIDLEPRLTHISAVEPTLAPVSVERTMTTRAAASNALRQQRFVREVTIQYNLCNEPWVKYCINAVADKGLKKPLYTSARLKKGEVLYLETHFNRYELSFVGEKAIENGTVIASSRASESEHEKTQNHSSHLQTADRNQEHGSTIDVFRWSRCKKPLPQKAMLSFGIPLPIEHVEVMEENLDWEDVQWSQTGVWVAGKEYALARVHFLSPS